MGSEMCIRDRSRSLLSHLKHKKHPRHPHPACGKRFHPAKIPRPKRRGLRGNMVPFPAALCAAGTPMGWTLVAPFLELPPSCAALAALANRARPAMRCRTAFPQKCRDCPPGAFSLGPLQRPVLFSREKRMGGWEAPLLEGVTSAPFGAHRKVWPRSARNPPSPAGAFPLRRL